MRHPPYPILMQAFWAGPGPRPGPGSGPVPGPGHFKQLQKVGIKVLSGADSLEALLAAGADVVCNVVTDLPLLPDLS